MSTHFTGSLQENLLTLMGHDDEYGRVVALLAEPELFEGDYRLMAMRFRDYFKRYGLAPKGHVADLFDDLLADPHNRQGNTIRRILTQMAALAEGINAQYVISQLRNFVRTQKLKAAVVESATRLQSKDELAIEEVEEIWAKLLRARDVAFDAGLNLMDIDRVLSYLSKYATEFSFGIKELDVRNVVPSRGTTTLLLGAAGVGKTWGLIHVGKRALLQRKKVLHISLEMAEELVAQRYYQSLFAVPKRRIPVSVSTLDLTEQGKLLGFGRHELNPEFTFKSPMLKDELENRINWFGARFSNIVIKRFPPRQLSMSMLDSYLSNLETSARFVPDMVILDYIGIVKTDSANHRISLGREFEEFRGIMVERNMAGVTAHQVSKAGSHAKLVTSEHVAEDWSLIATSDQVITYTATASEARRGLGRLYVSKARTEEDRFGLLITQNYQTGQFVIESTMLPSNYFDLLADPVAEEEDGEDAPEKKYGANALGEEDLDDAP